MECKNITETDSVADQIEADIKLMTQYFNIDQFSANKTVSNTIQNRYKIELKPQTMITQDFYASKDSSAVFDAFFLGSMYHDEVVTYTFSEGGQVN